MKSTRNISTTPRSFAGVIKGRSPEVRRLAQSLRDVVFEELPDAQESYYGGRQPMALYRMTADICWLQPLTSRCNIYFTRGVDLTDTRSLLEGSSASIRHVKIRSAEEIEQFPVRQWLRESAALNEAELRGGMNFDQVRGKLQAVCLALPSTKETITWGRPHFRVGEKIFCGCGEDRGRPSVGLKAEPAESVWLMKLPGIRKAPYSRPGDGWIAIDPNEFDDWEEIERLIVGSYRLIAPKGTAERPKPTGKRRRI
jgi:predicted DNA-binding protein (MmcQ/YjbR family)